MSVKIRYFYCAECGNRRRVDQLSAESIDLADVNTASKALIVLNDDEKICTDCSHNLHEDDEFVGASWGITLSELAENELGRHNSDPGRLSALYQNY
jgi:hypothetical protein